MDLMRRDWAIRQCQQFFGLSEADVAFVEGPDGRERLLNFWRQYPEEYYEHPLPLLRQEWWHAANAAEYLHGGFWAALPDGGIVLDYGCGTGEVSRLPWIARGGNIVLADESKLVTAYIRNKYAQYPLAWPQSPERVNEYAPYDALICTDVFEHVPNPLEVQQQLWDLLKPGGHALLKFESAFPHPGHLEASIAQLPAWWQWVKATTEVIEAERYLWVRKPK